MCELKDTECTCHIERTEDQKENNMCKFPEVEVELVGQDGNAFAILGAVSKAMRRAKIDEQHVDEFMKEAMSGDYDHLLQTAMKTVTVN